MFNKLMIWYYNRKIKKLKNLRHYIACCYKGNIGSVENEYREIERKLIQYRSKNKKLGIKVLKKKLKRL